MSGKLKKLSKKIMILSLAMTFTVQTLAVSQYPSKTQAIKEDPYALMYDSDERLIEEINNLPDYFASEEAIGPSVNAEMTTSDSGRASINSKSIISASDTNEADKNKSEMVRAKEDIIQTIRTGQFDDIDQMDISDRLKDRVMDMREDIRQDRFIIRYSSSNKGDISSYISKAEEEIGIQEKHRSGSLELLVLDEKVNPKELADTLKASGADKTIEYIQPDFRLSYSSKQESLNLFLSESSDNADNTYESADEENAISIEAPASTEDINAATDLSEVIVAVIDTGIDITHPDLADYIWHNPNDSPDDGADNDGNGYIDDIYGWNFYSDNNSTYDSQYSMQDAHGTHIAGIIASNTSNYNVKIMPLKVFGDNGAYTSDIIDAIYYAEANGARVANCSFGSAENNPALREAIENSDMLFVCSVGNARTDLNETPIYPACFDLDNIVSVTSTNADGVLSYYSNYSDELVDVAALGRDVYSTLPEGTYGKQSGTSMSAAQVSSVAAAVLCLQGDLNITQLKTRLINTADKLSSLQAFAVDGRQINMDNAVNDLEQTEVIENTPDNDFNVNGYNSAQSDLYQLYSSGDVIQVESGYSHIIVLKKDGTVWSWGCNLYAELGNGERSYYETLTQVIGLNNVVCISANIDHNLALKSDGTIWAWGYNLDGELGNGTTTLSSIPVQVSGLTNVISVSSGYSHSVALRSDGTVWTWGDNSYGQLGNGTVASSTTPVQVSGLTNVTYISAGSTHCLVIKFNGTVWAWGCNYFGELGNGTTNTSTLPVQVSGLTGVINVAAGSMHSLAVKSDGTVWAWGRNNYGQLGNGTTSNSTTPIQSSGLTGIVKVATGSYHSLAIKSNGTTWAWGCNNNGQLGNGTTTTQKTPVQISALSGVIDMNAAGLTSVAVKSDGTVWTWGDNMHGQLGNGTANEETTPVQAVNLSGVTYVAAGYEHSIAVKSNGTAWTWGNNDYGQLGDGTTVLKASPVQASGLTNVIRVAAGRYHSLALKSDGTVWAWGYNFYGQLGNGTTTTKTTPVQVSGLTGVIGIAAGGTHSLAVKSDGTVWAWGENGFSQLGDGTTTKRTTPKKVSSLTGVVGVAGGDDYSLAVKSNGTVWAWGDNYCGQLGNGTTTVKTTPVQVSSISSVANVAAGDCVSYAKKTDGTLWTWGENTFGELGIGSTTDSSTTPVQVSTLAGIACADGGYCHGIAAKLDGTVWTWGKNGAGQLGIGTEVNKKAPVQVSEISGAVSVAGGYEHSLAAKSDGTVWAWGDNSVGQLGYGHIFYSTVPIQAQTYIPGVYFLEQSYAVTIMPNNATISVSAQATDKYGVISNANIVYSLVSTYAGVSINSSTGVVTVTSAAVPGSVQVKATYGSYNRTTTLVLQKKKEVYLNFLQETYSTAILPYAKTVLVSAQATNENGEIITDAQIVYGLVNTYTGVSVNSSTGVVTITNDALADSVQLIATYENVSCTATLILQDGGLEVNGEAELPITTVAGNQYDISLMISNIESFDGTSFSLTYDPAVFEVLDLCAFTFEKEITASTIQQAGITIISFTPGKITFSVDKAIASNKKWSGSINIFKFKALSSNSTVVGVTEYWT